MEEDIIGVCLKRFASKPLVPSLLEVPITGPSIPHAAIAAPQFQGGAPGFVTPQNQQIMQANRVNTQTALIAPGESVFMQTATAYIKNPDTEMGLQVRILFDCGSQRSYITGPLAQLLNLKKSALENLLVYTFGSTEPKQIKASIVEIDLCARSGTCIRLSCSIIPQITGEFPKIALHLPQVLSLVRQYPLADSLVQNEQSVIVDMLIGNDYYWDIVEPTKIQLLPGLYLIDSKLGFLLSGRIPNINPSDSNYSFMSIEKSSRKTKIDSVLKDDISNLWSLENLGIKDDPYENDDDKALQTFTDTIKFLNGRYYVTWPWKELNPSLPSNYYLSLGRLKSVLKRLKSDPELLSKYDSTIKEQLSKGIVEEVFQENTNNLKHYIPHHAVITPKKLRIVYDASAKSKKENLSLNDCLRRGPVLREDLCRILLRFRLHKIGIIADIEKAFLQIGLQERDRDVTRFLWIKDITKEDVDNNLQVYRFARVPFGVISSPFLLAATVAYLLNNEKSQNAALIKRDIYVDNVITGVETLHDANNLYLEVKAIFNKASMNLREWNSNSIEFLKTLPEHDRIDNTEQKVLGLMWNTNKDSLSVIIPNSPKAEETRLRKRDILSRVASFFDPLGIISPILLEAKLFIQSLWQKKLDWDSELDDADSENWKAILKKLQAIPILEIPRYLELSQDPEIICFVDASKNSYCAVIYLRSKCRTDWKTNIIFAKTRVAPVRKITIPRLELLAVVVGVKCLKFVKEKINVPFRKTRLFSDSQCVLHWLNERKPLSVFVENRLKQIREEKNMDFRYVSTSDNPADLGTRISSTNMLDTGRWLHGPPWLANPESTWPVKDFTSATIEADKNYQEELKGEKLFFSISTVVTEKKLKPPNYPYNIPLENYSSLQKVLRITSWCTRFLNNLKGPKIKNDILEAQELEKARQKWEISVQKSEFAETIDAIKSGKKDEFKDKLGLELDAQGILRCHGRLSELEKDGNSLFPVLLT